jgi:conjugative transfer relaxase protein TraI
MLSVVPLKSAKGAADYYTAAFEYYAGDAQAMRWLGTGARRLGLTGVVEKEQMLALLEGRLPNGKVLQNKMGEHRPGFDMTFSAPKSVSILIGLSADPQLEGFHDMAVEKAIQMIEKEFAQARVMIEGKVYYVNTKELIVAAFRQPSSRANDPNTHTHGVTMNMTFTDEDGKARSLASDIHGNFGVIEQLQQHITYAGLLYRTEFSNLLKGAGYTLCDIGKGLFEIAGMPKEVLKEFSTRRNDIEAKMEEEGWEGSRLASKATLLTRDAKEEHDINVLRADWQQRADNLGFNAHEFVKSHKAQDQQEPLGFFASLKEKLFGRFYEKDDLMVLHAKEAVEVAIEIVAQQTSVFELRQLKEAALKHTLAGRTIVTIEAIDKTIQQTIHNKQLYEGTDPITQQTMLTTPWALTMETETLARIEANKGLLKPIASVHALTQAQKTYEAQSPFSLTPSQKNALLHVFTTTDRFNAIQGFAGSGKTTMLKLTAQIAAEKGFNLRGVAVTSAAVNELNAKAGIHSSVFPIVHQELLRAKANSLQKTIYILDEASMLSTIQGHELMKLIEQKGARLFLVGDDGQLSSVKCGRIFGQTMQYGIQTSEITHIIRQTNEQAKEAVKDAINRELYDSVQKLDEVRELKTHDLRIEEIARHWLSLSQAVRERTLVFAPTHANRREITQIIREGLKKEGTLSGYEVSLNTLKPKALEEVQHHHVQYYQPGDVLRFNIHLPRSRIKAGDYLTVGDLTTKHGNSKTIPLTNSEGKSVLLHLKDLPEYKPTRAGLNRPIEFYETATLALCINDQVLVTRNNNQSGMVNSSLASVKSLDENQLTLVFEKEGNEKTFPLDATELKHIDHGYVLTNMKVQGKDKPYAIGLIESYNKLSATLRNYYVQISRAISRMTLVTDDKTRLLKALEINDDTKKSALDYVSSNTAKYNQARFEKNAHAIPAPTVLEQKTYLEKDLWHKQALIKRYAAAKEQEKTAVSSKLAFQIVTDLTLRQMARHQLGTSETAIRQDAFKLSTLKLLKGLSQDEREKALTVKAYLNTCQQTQKAWQSVHKGNFSLLQKTIAFDKSLERNRLAHQIAEHIEAYKPYLHHFSIGKLNRFGVSQYRIEKGEEQAVGRLTRLSVHAEKHQVYRAVDAFFNEGNSEKKEVLAALLKMQSKEIHPHLIRLSEKSQKPLDELWREINKSAKESEDKAFKASLNENEKPLFDRIKAYKALNTELAVHFASSLYLIEKGKEIPKAIVQKQAEVVSLRNQIAATAYNDASFNKLLQYFKVDRANLEKQATKHSMRETVLDFKQSQSNFEKKKEAALLIASDIKGHYPFIKELEVNTKTLNTLMRIEARKALISELIPEHKNDYLKLIDYKVTSRKATSIWKSIFLDKEQGKAPNEHDLNRAQSLTAKRDSLAFSIKNKKELKILIEEEKVDSLKLETQARLHKARLKTVAELNQTKEKLLDQLETRVSQMNNYEARTWHKNWQVFNKSLWPIVQCPSLYEKAIENTNTSPLTLTDSQKTLLSRHELKLKPSSEKSTSPSTKEIWSNSDRPIQQKNFLDATVITDALVAKPEESYRAIFGEPKKITSKEMRYSGGLVVSLKGSKAGFWYDFSEGVGGSPIQALMREQGLSFQEALKEGAAIAGISGLTTSIVPQPKAKQPDTLSESEEEKNKILSAKSILKGGIPIVGTLAERYLKEHRSIENPGKLNVLFWPKGASWLATDEKGKLYEKPNKIPALLITAKNEKGEITGVQRVYLDEKTGGKNTFMEDAKLSKGKIEGSAGLLQKGEKLGTLYLAEGPETGASIAMANPKATVLVSFGLYNLKNLKALIKSFHPTEVIIAGDNDSLAKNNTLKATIESQELLRKNGVEAKIIMPKIIQGMKKTDWNDVHCLKGLDAVKQQLGLEIVTKDIRAVAMQLSQEKANQADCFSAFNNKVTNTINQHISMTSHEKEQIKTIYNNSIDSNKMQDKSKEIDIVKQQNKHQKILDREI